MGLTRGVVIHQGDAGAPSALIESRARAAHCAVVVQAGWGLSFDRCLFVSSGMRLEPELIEAGMRWLARWDVAAALMGPGYLAGNVGSGAERARTLELVRDLRVPMYDPDILFVARNESGERLLEAYQEEGEGPQGFLRALYRTKPRILALPRQWILRDGRVEARESLEAEKSATTRVAEPPRAESGLINVEVPGRPGAYVKCFPSEREKVIKRFERERRRSQGRAG